MKTKKISSCLTCCGFCRAAWKSFFFPWKDLNWDVGDLLRRASVITKQIFFSCLLSSRSLRWITHCHLTPVFPGGLRPHWTPASLHIRLVFSRSKCKFSFFEVASGIFNTWTCTNVCCSMTEFFYFNPYREHNWQFKGWLKMHICTIFKNTML